MTPPVSVASGSDASTASPASANAASAHTASASTASASTASASTASESTASESTARESTASGRALVVPLDAACDASGVGAKAARLAQARAAGFPVPPAVVVLPAARGASLRRERSFTTPSTGAAPGSDAGEGRGGGSRDAPLGVERELLDAIDAALRAQDEPGLDGATRWIVRSSGLGEDCDAASFAGQLDSVGGVRTRAELASALRVVWASLDGARVRAYEAARGVRLRGLAVLVQREVEARAAGVLFTRHPSPDRRESMLIEWIQGAGEDLVQGRRAPGQVVVARDAATTSGAHEAWPEGCEDARALGDETPARLRAMGLRLEALFGAPQDVEWVVDGEGALHVVQSRAIADPSPGSAGGEGAFDGGRTAGAIASRRSLRVEPTRRFTSANVAENFPDPVTPFLASVVATGYEHLFRGLGQAFGIAGWRLDRVDHALRRAAGFPGGRVHYDLTSIREVLSAAPFGDGLAALFARYVGVPREDATSASHVGPSRAGVEAHGPTRWSELGSRATQVAEAAAIAAHVAWCYRDLSGRVARFERVVDDFAARAAPAALASKNLAELGSDLRAFITIRTRWTDANLADVAAMVTTGLLGAALERFVPRAPGVPLAPRLLGGVADLVSTRPVAELRDLARRAQAEPAVRELLAREPDDRRALASLATPSAAPSSEMAALAGLHAELLGWIDRWGFRRSGELMLVRPSFEDEPWRVIGLIRGLVAEPHRPDTACAGAPRVADHASAGRASDASRAAAEAELRTALGAGLRGRALAGALLRLAALARGALGLRERARLRQALLYTRLRGVALALGDRLAARGLLERADDVWFLTWQEVDALVSGGALDPGATREVAALRRRRHALHPPSSAEVVDVGPGGEVRPATPPSTMTTSSPSSATPDDVLRGMGASPGRAAGTARVLADVAEASRIEPSDVLVVRQTDPGWAAALLRAGGLVVERGGLLSHGAVVARELGVPTVVGVKDATRRIADGRAVVVDGDAGHVLLG